MPERRSVMLVEDEKLIALDVELTLEEMGYEVIGSFDTVDRALAGLAEQDPDFALLDVTLKRREMSFPIAEALQERGIPFAFLTGYTRETKAFPAHLDEVDRIQKPVSVDALKSILEAEIP